MQRVASKKKMQTNFTCLEYTIAFGSDIESMLSNTDLQYNFVNTL
jgi:hypothetical protein